MLRAFRLTWDIFTLRERKVSVAILAAIVFMAFVEVGGIASVLPFLSVVADPSMIFKNRALHYLYEVGGFSSDRSFLMFLGFGVLTVLALSNLAGVLTAWAFLRFTWGRNHAFSARLLQRYMARDYAFFLGVNSSELAKNILSEVEQVVSGILVPGMRALAAGAVASAIVVLLVIVDPSLALLMAGVLGGAYVLVFGGVRRVLGRKGLRRLAANEMRYKVAAEALGGIKEIKLAGAEPIFSRAFSVPSREFALNRASHLTLSLAPKHILEVVAFGGMVGILLHMLSAGRELSGVLPQLGLYAFAGYRLLPALQQVFNGATSARYSVPALEVLHRELREPERKGLVASAPLPLGQGLELESVWYKYPGSEQWAVRGASLSIPSGHSVGLVGATGSGKSTLVDLMLGLLTATKGAVRVGGVALDEVNVRAWQMNVGYVPQEIYLVDGSIASNIAFGVPLEEIDMSRVEWAAKVAQAHDFITKEFSEGYETFVGERGVRMSGGQRQRIGIARALYRKPKVLVLDEATSALDAITENMVMEGLRALQGVTVVLVAHRLGTVASCQSIFVVADGMVAASGSYDELARTEPRFRALLQAANVPVME